MARNIDKDAKEIAERTERILREGFYIFSEKTIESVTMNEIAKRAGVGVATVYRYYKTKPALVIAIGTKIWEEYIADRLEVAFDETKTACENLDLYLESFLDLYRNHKDILRFNQFFNVYLQSVNILPEELQAYNAVIRFLSDRFHLLYAKAEEDLTLRTDIPEEEMFSAITHLMLAAVTRYAVGLIYNVGTDPEKELWTLKDMFLKTYSQNPG